MHGSKAALVAVGGVAGASARWAIAAAIGSKAVPWALLAINVTGSFVLGLVAFRAATGHREALRLAVGVGFCGGLTTFSGFAVETADLLGDGRGGVAVIVVIGSLAGGVAAVILGARLRHRFDPLAPPGIRP